MKFFTILFLVMQSSLLYAGNDEDPNVEAPSEHEMTQSKSTKRESSTDLEFEGDLIEGIRTRDDSVIYGNSNLDRGSMIRKRKNFKDLNPLLLKDLEGQGL